MSEQQDMTALREALSLRRLALPKEPEVLHLDITVGTDVGDDPAVFVTAVLHDSFRDSEWTSERLNPIEDAMREAVSRAGIERWVYVRFIRESDVRAAG